MESAPTLPPNMVANKGSNARDFCMLERNLLSHLKLALLLSLLSSSLLLRSRLVPEPDKGGSTIKEKDSLPLAGVEFAAAIAAIIAGVWEYYNGCRDLRDMRAFLVAVKAHAVIMAVVVAAVFATCIVLLVEEA